MTAWTWGGMDVVDSMDMVDSMDVVDGMDMDDSTCVFSILTILSTMSIGQCPVPAVSRVEPPCHFCQIYGTSPVGGAGA